MTTTTRLFEACVDEQLIMLCTGHGVWAYKRVSQKLKEVTSDVLNGVETAKRLKVEQETKDAVLSSNLALDPPNASSTVVPDSTVAPNPPSSSSLNLEPVMNFSGASNFHINFNYSGK